jgi:hypothetical protein
VQTADNQLAETLLRLALNLLIFTGAFPQEISPEVAVRKRQLEKGALETSAVRYGKQADSITSHHTLANGQSFLGDLRGPNERETLGRWFSLHIPAQHNAI